MKKIALFDLDGTLLNTLEDLTDSTNYALNCLKFPPKTIAQVRTYVGNGVAKLIERAIPDGTKNPNYEKCLELFKENYKKNMCNKTRPYEKILQMLQSLKSKNIKIGIISNKFDVAVKALCQKYFNGLYDIALGENEELGIKKKPSPDLVLSVLDLFQIKKSEAIYIGDSEVDIQTAQNAEIDCISVLWGFKDEDFLLKNGAKNIVKSPDELLKYF